jgi:hypothetical protein
VRISVCEVCVGPAFLFRRALWNLVDARLKAGATNQCRVLMPGTHAQFSRTLLGAAHLLTLLCRPCGAPNISISCPHRFTVGYDLPSLTGLVMNAKVPRRLATEVAIGFGSPAPCCDTMIGLKLKDVSYFG